MRALGHLTPGYMVRRMRLALYQRRHPDAPWLTRQAIELLDALLRPQDVGVEWGSGRSTMWLSRRLGRLTSIEHDPSWFAQVQRDLQWAGVEHVDYRHVDHREMDAESRPFYVRAVASLPEGSVDFVLVDGKHRGACALEALRILRPGGILVVDNANVYLPSATTSPGSAGGDAPLEETWRLFVERTRSWRSIWTSNGVFDTALWIRMEG